MRGSWIYIALIYAMAFTQYAFAQETVFALLKNDERLADSYYEQHNYKAALELYKKSLRKHGTSDVSLKMARCYFSLKDYAHAIEQFGHVIKADGKLSSTDLYLYAESFSSRGEYTKAVEAYRQYLVINPGDGMVAKKIWRLNNIQYVLEDSSQYSLRNLTFNTAAGDLCAVPLNSGLVFLSNRHGIPIIEKTDAATATPFYKAWFVEIKEDSLRPGLPFYTKAAPFSAEPDSKFHAGPVSFFDNGTRMVYTTTGDPDPAGFRPLQLSFAELKNGKWIATGKFPHNGTNYSNTDPSMTENGMKLYFSSDRAGGMGGKDLYVSTLTNGKWSIPENLGDEINTRRNEITPFILQDHTLYFASDGLPGIGGMDVFRSESGSDGFQEPQLLGYPLNTSADEFGAYLDSTGTRGYLSSNRKNGKFDDDVYEFEMDLQTYPLVLSGLLRFKEHNWKESSDLQPFVNVKIELIDNIRNVTVFESTSDAQGNFSITVPRFSNYRIRVVESKKIDHVVSLEIPRQRKLYTNHEIVIVKDAFRSENENIK